ncbi:peptidoglycan D,D-transpeptidase FtsI family protein [Limnobacter litoralis]|uniref:Peptidoglycan D,D-transpeptidase FtsI n=1 Tax=Limnobacter litoralis TaxID=481366 RepID=A0ABQ5YNB3_9BURK|nr:penicillin-binding protein 2 [Limnobacter litoralis]GLR26064.1 peptidoglycan synthetase FtsI [Limnobacter litoralis]
MSKGVRFGRTTDLLETRLPAWRSRFVLLCILLAFGGLILRAAYLQIVSDDFLQQQGAKRMERTLPLHASRGTLFDRNNVVLAQSIPAQAIWYDGRKTKDATDAELTQLAKLLGMNSSRLIQQVRGDEKRAFVYLERQVEPDLAKQVKALKVPGVGFLTENKRYYPLGETTAHLVGFTNLEDSGQEGLELAFNDRLTGEDGERSVLRDRLGNIIEDVREIRPPVNGQDMVLSVDSDIQYIVSAALKKAVEYHAADAGAAVVLDAKTGEVLALASVPTYDPNDRSDLHGPDLRNRVFTDTFEPGSTLKPFTVSLALDKGFVKPDSMIDTGKGYFSIGPATIHDTHAHGLITVGQVIQFSSNIGSSKIALSMPSKYMWDNFHLLGFGQAPNVHFPGAVAGRVRPWNSWRPIEQATMSYGHGIAVSLIQLAQAYTVFANQGYFVPVSLLKRKPGEEPRTHQVFSEKTAAEMLHMLELAAGPDGTAPKSQVAGYRVAGKTGTAHKDLNGRYVDKYVASFVGLAPVSNPRIIVAVMVDNPTKNGYYGGEVAAPVFSVITKNVLTKMDVQPDAIQNTQSLKKYVQAPSGRAAL